MHFFNLSLSCLIIRVKEREEQEKRIREEWEAKEKREQEKKDRSIAARKKKDDMLEAALSNLDGRNPEAPKGTEDVSEEVFGTERDPRNCTFYMKTGACRFGPRCSRIHLQYDSSTTIMIPNMFHDVRLSIPMLNENNDSAIEYDEFDLIIEYERFYEDVISEFLAAGKVVMFKCSKNYVPHLRGNVYVQYEEETHAAKAREMFNGRWYAGRQLSVFFSPVNKWQSAICGLHDRRKCPRGKQCNFLHVFKNPRNAFSVNLRADWNSERGSRGHKNSGHQDSDRRSSNKERYNSRQRNRSDWSRHSRQRSLSRSSSRSNSRSRSRSPDRRSRRKRSRSKSPRRARSRSISPSLSTSTSTSRRRSRSRSRESNRHRKESKSRRQSQSSTRSKDRSRNSKTSTGSVNRPSYKQSSRNGSIRSVDQTKDNTEKQFKFKFKFIEKDNSKLSESSSTELSGITSVT